MKTLAFYILLTICALSPLSLQAASNDALDIRIREAELYLDEIMSTPDTAIPSSLLARAYGIIIVRQYKGGFIIGGKGGNGVAMARHSSGQWSPPAFVTNAEGSIGFQIGGQSIDSIFLIMNEEGMSILHKSKFKIGVDASAAAGPVGRDAEAKVSPNAAILAYSRAKGLYIGATIEGGALMADKAANKEYYQDANVTTEGILFDDAVRMPEAGRSLAQKLENYSAGNQ